MTRVFLVGCLQQVKLDIEEKYTSLQDEVSGKTKKLKKVWQMLGQAKSEVSHSQPQSCTYICRLGGGGLTAHSTSVRVYVG